MAYLDSGVSDYIHCQATVDVFFPIDRKGVADVSCAQCFFFRKNYSTCGLNGEVCQYPSKYVGGSCPLKPVDNDMEENNEET